MSNAIKHLNNNGCHNKIIEEDKKKIETALQVKSKLDGVKVRLLVAQYSFSFRSYLNYNFTNTQNPAVKRTKQSTAKQYLD